MTAPGPHHPDVHSLLHWPLQVTAGWGQVAQVLFWLFFIWVLVKLVCTVIHHLAMLIHGWPHE
jgi:hypothetical protein